MKFNINHSGTKVALGLAFLVTITLSMGLYSLQENTNFSAITARMYKHPLTVSNAVREVRADILAMHRSTKDVALSQDTSQLEKAVRDVDLLEQNVFKEFDIIEERFLGDKGEGLTVVIAVNGQQALGQIAQESPFDIVLMDIMMPIMDGYMAIRKIRAQNALSDLPIIALTAKAMNTDRAEGLNAGANDFLAKPVNLTHLLDKIQQQIRPKDNYGPPLPTIFSTSPLARSIRPQTALSKT